MESNPVPRGSESEAQAIGLFWLSRSAWIMIHDKQKIKEYFKNEIINEQDGIKIIAENYWAHIRKSNTEPILRLFVESEDKDISERTLQMIKNILSINA